MCRRFRPTTRTWRCNYVHTASSPHLPLNVEHNSVALRHLRSCGMDETVHIRANGPRAVIHELFATYGGKMLSLQASRHKTSETAKRPETHPHMFR